MNATAIAARLRTAEDITYSDLTEAGERLNLFRPVNGDGEWTEVTVPPLLVNGVATEAVTFGFGGGQHVKSIQGADDQVDMVVNLIADALIGNVRYEVA